MRPSTRLRRPWGSRAAARRPRPPRRLRPTRRRLPARPSPPLLAACGPARSTTIRPGGEPCGAAEVSFADPPFLVGLALIPLLVALYARAERRPHTFAPAKLLPSVAPRRAGWRRHVA